MGAQRGRVVHGERRAEQPEVDAELLERVVRIWGLGDRPTPFRIHLPDAALEDLRLRLRRTRWLDEQQDVGWQQGIPLSTMRELAAHWADGFDWRAQEERLNALDQVTTIADGAHLPGRELVSGPEPSTTPTAGAVFPNGIAGSLPIRRFAERVNVITRWTELDRGGHFPALEVPELLLEDLMATFG